MWNNHNLFIGAERPNKIGIPGYSSHPVFGHIGATPGGEVYNRFGQKVLLTKRKKTIGSASLVPIQKGCEYVYYPVNRFILECFLGSILHQVDIISPVSVVTDKYDLITRLGSKPCAVTELSIQQKGKLTKADLEVSQSERLAIVKLGFSSVSLDYVCSQVNRSPACVINVLNRAIKTRVNMKLSTID